MLELKDASLYLVPVAGGMAVSLLYHVGLWWTVRALPRSRRPLLLSIGSFYLRMTVTVIAFYMIMQNDWKRAAVCLAGFVAVKFVLMRIQGNTSDPLSAKGRMH